ncbi:hypothetical protein KCW65_22670, partial [Mycobacterium tuberculosis]|nr:hypothetical protein [Mycobacterium tuberculosis]
EDRVALASEPAQGTEEELEVGGVESRRGFVEDVEDSEEPAAQLRGEVEAFEFAARERRGGAGDLEVAEAEADESAELVDEDVDEGLGGLVAFDGELPGGRVGAGVLEERD